MKPDKSESKDIDSTKALIIVFIAALVVVGFYIFKFTDHLQNFDSGLSKEPTVWGTFGDYVGGILNPVIAAFAFYLIAKTYELQKKELEATRSLLEVSTDAQQNQIKLAALTAILNSNLIRIEWLVSKKLQILIKTPVLEDYKDRSSWIVSNNEVDEIDILKQELENRMAFKSDESKDKAKELFAINSEIESLTIENESLRNKINSFVE